MSLTDGMKNFLQHEAMKRGYSTPAEFVQSLLVKLQAREEDRKRLDEKLREGLCTPAIDADDEFWRELEQEFIDRHPELKS